MNPLLILLIGMVTVIGSVLWLKLHAFLALMAGSLVVAALTPSGDLFRRELIEHGIQIESVSVDGEVSCVDGSAIPTGQYVGLRLDDLCTPAILDRVDVNAPSIHPRLVPQDTVDDGTVAVTSGDWLVDQRDYAHAQTLRDANWAERIATGFGNTCAKIGIIIALAAIIGRCLLDSGAASRIVSAMRTWLGDRNTPIALVLSGFLIGIPVFFDTVFYLLLPLARALGGRTGRNYLLYVLSIIVGATMAHSLVPPTPGPLLVASELNVSLGRMILTGGLVGLIATTSGYAYAVWANRRWTVPIREPHTAGSDTGIDAVAEESTPQQTPTLWMSLVPILLPVCLLSAGTFLKADAGDASSASELSTMRSVLELLSDKHIALGLATIAAVVMLVRHAPPGVSWVRAIHDALMSAGSIVLITAAGGAFGHVLRQSGIAHAVQEQFPVTQAGLGLLLAAFFITAVVRVAQGSATVAMITAVGIIAPIVAATNLPFHPVYVAIAIGCGSKPLPWMNDSGFWVITRMSGMTESETLRTYTVALTIMGFVGIAVTLAAAVCFPMV